MSELSPLDAATEAFRADINPNTAPAEPKASRSAAPVERMFEPRGIENEEGYVEPEDEKEPAAGDDEPEGDEGEPEGDGEAEEGDEGETDGEEDLEEPDEDAEQAKFYAQKVEVTVDGKPEEVTIKEALEGYIRTKTFHQRMNQVNEAVQVVTQEARTVREQRERYMQQNADLEATLKELMPEEPDWDKLYAEDPGQAHSLKKQYDAYKGKITALQETRNRAIQDQREHTARATQTFIKDELAKFVSEEGIDTEEAYQKETSSMRRTALAAGFTEEEVGTVYDSRMLKILRKASKYDRMMAAKSSAKAVIPGKSKTLVPGSGKGTPGPTVRNGPSNAAKTLARTGRLDDAASYFQATITGPRR